MRPSTLATGFSKYKQDAFLVKSNLIHDCLSGNEAFPDPDPSLKALLSDIAAFANTLSAPPSKANTQSKKKARVSLTATLKLIALYIIATGKGNIEAYETTGFSLTKQPQPVGVLPKPKSFTAEPYYLSAIKLKLNKISGADGYNFEYALLIKDQPLVWMAKQDTKTTLIISNLDSGSKYAFRVCGIGSNAGRVYSDVVYSYVL